MHREVLSPAEPIIERDPDARAATAFAVGNGGGMMSEAGVVPRRGDA